MDIFFQDPNEVPLPPEEVRIREFHAEPWPDGRRVRIYLELDPFQKRPSADVFIANAAADVVAEVSIIETMTRKLEFNMHLREPNPSGVYEAQVVLYYQPLIEKPAADQEEHQEQPGAAQQPQMVIDRGQVSFSLPVDQ